MEAVRDAILDLARAPLGPTSVARVRTYVNTLSDDAALSTDEVRALILAQRSDVRQRVSDAVVAAAGASAAPAPAPVVAAPMRRFVVQLQCELDPDGTLRVLRTSGPPAYALSASADYRGADPSLPVHVFVRPSQ